MKNLFILFAILFVGGLTYGTYRSFESPDLKDIAGRAEDDREPNPVDVPKLIELAAKNRKPITITERQMNTWLADTLKGRQEGFVAEYVKMEGVWVCFDDDDGGRAEVVIERAFMGRPHTVSMFFRIERKKKEDGTYTTFVHKDSGRIFGLSAAGGRFGQIRVPQGFLFFTHQAFSALGKLFEEELRLMEIEITSRGGGRILFEKNQLRIDFPKD